MAIIGLSGAPLTPGQNERQAVLGDRAVVECGFVEDQRRGGFVRSMPSPLKSAMANSTCASVLSASAA